MKPLLRIALTGLFPVALLLAAVRVVAAAGHPAWKGSFWLFVVACLYAWAGQKAFDRFVNEPGPHAPLRFLARHAIRHLAPYLVAAAFYVAFPLLVRRGRPLLPWLDASRAQHAIATWGPEVLRAYRVVASAIAAIVVGLAVHFCFPLPEASKIVRGRRIYTLQEAARIANRQRPWGDPGIPLAGLRIPLGSGTLGIICWGSPGSGKSLQMLQIQCEVLPRVGEGKDVRAVLFDIKIECLPLVAGFGVPYKLMNVLDRRTVGWLMGADITSDPLCEAAVDILVPKRESSKDANGSFFDNAGRILMMRLMSVYSRISPGNWEFRDVIVGLSNPWRLRHVLMQTYEGRNEVSNFLADEKLFNDIRATTRTFTAPFIPIAAAWHKAKEKISLADFVHNEYCLVLGWHNDAKPILAAMNRVLFQRLSQLLCEPGQGVGRKPTTKQTWVFGDELRQILPLTGLDDLLVEGRSRGVYTVVGAQDKSGVTVRLGDENSADDLIGLFAHTVFFRSHGVKGLAHAASLFGEYEGYEKPNPNEDKEQLQKRDAVMSSEFQDMLLAGPQNDVPFQALSPVVGGGWKGAIPWKQIRKALRKVKPDPNVPNFDPAPPETFDLEPWTEGDYHRLNLPYPAEPGYGLDPFDHPPPAKSDMPPNVVEFRARNDEPATENKPRRRMKNTAGRKARPEDSAE